MRIARLAKASGAGSWIKIEVIQDNKYLLPDNIETLKATEILVKEGFVVLPYMSPDLSIAKRLVDAGAATNTGATVRSRKATHTAPKNDRHVASQAIPRMSVLPKRLSIISPWRHGERLS